LHRLDGATPGPDLGRGPQHTVRNFAQPHSASSPPRDHNPALDPRANDLLAYPSAPSSRRGRHARSRTITSSSCQASTGSTLLKPRRKLPSVPPILHRWLPSARPGEFSVLFPASLLKRKIPKYPFHPVHSLHNLRYVTLPLVPACAEDDRDCPRIFHVQLFPKDEQGRYVWPGYGENMRMPRLGISPAPHCRAYARETILGWMPRSLRYRPRKASPISREQFDSIQSVNISEVKAECDQ